MSFLRYQLIGHGAIIDNRGSNVAKRSTICSFFCDNRDRKFTKAAFVLQSLVWDILSQRHDLIHHALKFHPPPHTWSYNQLWRIFQALLDDPHISSVCVIIDALDECERRERNKLLNDLETYLERRSKTAHGSINFIVSSRPTTIGYLGPLKKHSSYFMLDQDTVLREYMAADIRRYILNDLLYDSQFSSREDPNSLAKIEALADSIASKSEGSFLWASLILEELHSRSYIKLGDVEDFISECPPDLYGIYYESLATVERTNRQVIVKSLHILLAARNP